MTAHRHGDTAERGIPPVAQRPDIACRPDDNPLFYVEGDAPEVRRAVALCRRCPHQADCLRWALDTRQQYGVWGGYTANQRTRLLKVSADALKATTRTAS